MSVQLEVDVRCLPLALATFFSEIEFLNVELDVSARLAGY